MKGSCQNDHTEKTAVLGLCLGASTISVVRLECITELGSQGNTPLIPLRVIDFSMYPHEGNPRQTLRSIFEAIDRKSVQRIAATGRNFRKFVNLSSLSEPEAVEYAYQFVKPEGVSCRAIVSAGGETTMVYVLDHQGRISNVLTGNKCASGTGEFFLQQLRRMNVSIEEAAQWASTEEPYHVSGRCSVFCKSDCTHATNKGIPKSKVSAGLCRMMANKIIELLKRVEKKDIMLTGGTAHNQMMVAYLRREISNLIIPEYAACFEALGAAIWAAGHETAPIPDIADLIKSETGSYDTLPPLADFKPQVEFKTVEFGTIRAGDDCILGLDVGSTTTKAVLMRIEDNALLASVYLRTNGDPIGASRLCYREILSQIEKIVDPKQISISGLGVCGSGRQIAGLHAMTDGVINEIIAHAAAAVHFDPKVDTIFEIGGQDAKYTYITNAVASDYAMNEACSAGTGSFLEESAYESLGVKMEAIADIALKGTHPPNFNDQCAAFIASDIKNAIHEGIRHEDIIAGLVYSICMNYSNRVKGNRPVGEKVFMQGGVCYNKAVPLAMASLVGKPIIVPPEPGLMGAYGVALEVKKRIAAGLMAKKSFDLQALVDREVRYGKSFICKGGKENCDRGCEIAMIELEDKKFPFGGACNRYYNLLRNLHYDVLRLDLVRKRQQLVYEIFGKSAPASQPGKSDPPTVGINRSFLLNTYYPLYSTFFTELGFRVVLPDSVSTDGIDKRNAAFCYPAELAHGFFYDLLERAKPPDYIFLPHFKAVPTNNGFNRSLVCPFVQGEPYYLKTAFKDRLEELEKQGSRLVSPLLDLTCGIADAEQPLVETAMEMGVSRKAAQAAFQKAFAVQTDCMAEMKRLGKNLLAELEAEPDRIAVVIFARPYNGFAEEAHKGIPHKLASRGIAVMPFDFLTFDGEQAKPNMYWGMGQMLLKAANVVKKHPQLFGLYITNFSCGPDSFVLGYVRDIMGQKPSLTLELDSHTADAGIETRIEAFLDIVSAYRQLEAKKLPATVSSAFVPAKTLIDAGVPKVITSSGQILPFTDPKVTFLIPSMGKIASESLAAVFKGIGINAIAHPPADEAILKLGRANTTCKECLPLILTTGMMLNQIQKRNGNVLVYFMATASGPCRFGQYYVFMEDLIRKQQIPDVALFSLTSDNSYEGIGNGFYQKAWWAFIVSDVMEDIRSMLLANARDVEYAMTVFNQEWNQILLALERGEFHVLENQLIATSGELKRIPLKRRSEEVPLISLVGEIFVRRDSLSRQNLTEKLAEKGFATVCAPVSEWIRYTDYLTETGITRNVMTWKQKLGFLLKKHFMTRYEKRIKAILSQSGLVHAEPIHISSVIKTALPYITPELSSESILTVGSALHEVASKTCGVIAIGPFGCMPNRLAEALLSVAMNRYGKLAAEPKNRRLQTLLKDIEDLPFLAIESDGSPFSQLIHAKLETFCLRAERLHERMRTI